MQIIATRIKERKKEILEYAVKPSFSVPWGINVEGLMIWGEAEVSVILPKMCVEKFENKTECWTEIEDGKQYLADFFVKSDAPCGVSLVFRDIILKYIKTVVERYVKESSDFKAEDLTDYILNSDEYRKLRHHFIDSKYGAEIDVITVRQIKKQAY